MSGSTGVVVFRGPRNVLELAKEVAHPLARGPGLVQGLEGEVEHPPVMGREEEIADVERLVAPGQDIGQGIEIALGFRHLLAVDDEVVAVEPVH